MSEILEKINQIIAEDPRYNANAYYFLLKCLNYSFDKFKKVFIDSEKAEKSKHISGEQLLQGIGEIALLDFGYMTQAVFNCWGITKTQDWGEIVYNMILRNLLSESDTDCKVDFKDVYDFVDAFDKAFFKQEYYKLPDEFKA